MFHFQRHECPNQIADYIFKVDALGIGSLPCKPVCASVASKTVELSVHSLFDYLIIEKTTISLRNASSGSTCRYAMVSFQYRYHKISR